MATGVGAMFAEEEWLMWLILSEIGLHAQQECGQGETALSKGQVMQLNNQMQALEALATSTPKVPKEMLNYAEIYIYEPMLVGEQTEWRLVAEHHFDRHYFETTAILKLRRRSSKYLEKCFRES